MTNVKVDNIWPMLTPEERERIADELTTKGYTTFAAKGAIPNGARVRKVNSEPNDGNPNGTLATVIGSIPADVESRFYFYFVLWDPMPIVPVGVMSVKLELAEEANA